MLQFSNVQSRSIVFFRDLFVRFFDSKILFSNSLFSNSMVVYLFQAI